VPDTLRALGDLGGWHRRRFAVDVVGVTGSNGKTTTKEMLGEVMAAGGKTLRTRGNLNNLIGVPQTLLWLDGSYAYAVIEMGMNVPGEIARYAEMAAPRVGLVLNAQAAHLEGLGSVEGVAKAKAELWQGLSLGGVLVRPAGDPVLGPVSDAILRQRGDLKTLSFGEADDADVRLVAHRSPPQGGTELGFEIGGRRHEAWIQHLGLHNALNAAAAVAAGLAMGLSVEVALRGLKNARPVRRRLSPLAVGGVVVVDDTYNANPGSARASLRAVVDARGRGRVIAVLGDMLELGEHSDEEHRELGRFVGRLDVTALVGFGPRSADTVAGAREAGLGATRAVQLLDPIQVLYWLRPRLRPGDWILLKGSRGMRMERIADAMVEDLGR
jgi:UDP-N-acetylmuramoyl-tripeptide--D-alanyl-D-alanine ligase